MTVPAEHRSMFRHVLFITLVEQLVVNAARPMASYRGLELGMGVAGIGMIAVAFTASSLLASTVAGGLIDRWSPRRVAIGGAVVMAAGAALACFGRTVPVLVGSQALLGWGESLVILSGQALLARFHRGRDQGFGMYTAAASLGQLGGPAVATAAALWFAGGAAGAGDPALSTAIDVVFVVCLLACGAQLWSSFALPSLPYETSGLASGLFGASLEHIRRTVRVPLMSYAIGSSVLLGMSLDLVTVYLPAYGQERGWSAGFVGLLLTVRGAAGMVSRLLLPPLMRLGRLPLLAGSLLLPAVGMALLPLTGPDGRASSAFAVAGAVAVVALLGFWHGVGAPVTIQWVGVLAGTTSQSTALALRLTGSRLGQTVAPAGAGILGATAGLASVFWALSGLLSLTTIGLIRAFRRQNPP